MCIPHYVQTTHLYIDAHVRPFSAYATLLDFEYNELTAESKYKVTTTANVHK